MLRLPICALHMIASIWLFSFATVDDLAMALRPVTPISELEEGVDYTIVMEAGGPQVLLADSSCFTASNLRCHDQAMHCAYVLAGATCVYCDGSGGAWTATNGICVQNPSSACLVNPAGQTGCGRQRRSTCGAAPGGLTCTTVPTFGSSCALKECT